MKLYCIKNTKIFDESNTNTNQRPNIKEDTNM